MPEVEFVRVEVDGELPFDDGAFDLVWSSEVIEHVSDTARWLRRPAACSSLAAC